MVLVSERTVVDVVELQWLLEDARRCKCADASTIYITKPHYKIVGAPTKIDKIRRKCQHILKPMRCARAQIRLQQSKTKCFNYKENINCLQRLNRWHFAPKSYQSTVRASADGERRRATESDGERRATESESSGSRSI